VPPQASAKNLLPLSLPDSESKLQDFLSQAMALNTFAE
jgi:hypothetical protein